MKNIQLATIAIGALIASSCIENDIPYPRIQPNFTSFVVEGESASSLIDTENRVVTVSLPETVNPYEVKVTSYTLDPDDSSVVGNPFDEPLNLTSPVEVTLKLYQEYVWTIKSVQRINRVFAIENQIGAATIDDANHRVVANVSDVTPLTNVRVLTMKLGPEGAEYDPDLSGKTVDFTDAVKVNVTAWGHTETWTIYVEPSQSTVTTVSVDSWTCVAWVKGSAEVGKNNGIQYRKVGDDQWTDVPSEWMTFDEGDFTARILHLLPNTEYETRAYSDSEFGATLHFTTGLEIQLPNFDLSHWSIVPEKVLGGRTVDVWCPWGVGDEPWWDSGNHGVATLNTNNSMPYEYQSATGLSHGAKLETVKAAIKLAAGNVFAGKYGKTDGLNAILEYGRPFTQRPTKMRVNLKYFPSTMNMYDKTSYPYMGDWMGRPDTCQIYIALIDHDGPYEIRSNPKNPQLFNPKDPMVIAYGRFESGREIPNWTSVDIPLDYTSVTRIPKLIFIACSSSKYGDYFCGGVGSTLYVDNIKMLYDY